MKNFGYTINDQEGFSLIEVLLAMGMFSIGLLAVLSLHINTTKFNANGNVVTMANMIAQKKIERVCTGKITDLDSNLSKATTDGFLIQEDNVNADGEKGIAGGIFTVKTKIYTCPQDNYLRKITVSVFWHRRGSLESVTYSTVTRGNTVEI